MRSATAHGKFGIIVLCRVPIATKTISQRSRRGCLGVRPAVSSGGCFERAQSTTSHGRWCLLVKAIAVVVVRIAFGVFVNAGVLAGIRNGDRYDRGITACLHGLVDGRTRARRPCVTATSQQVAASWQQLQRPRQADRRVWITRLASPPSRHRLRLAIH